MKKTTSNKLSKRLAQYGSLSMAIAGVASVNGQIVYHDLSPDFVGGIGDEYLLNLNFEADAIDDFRIVHDGGSDLQIEPLSANNEVLGIKSYSFPLYGLAYALSVSAPISASPTSGSWLNLGFDSGQMDLNYGSQASTCSVGYWCNVNDKYLGLRFNIGGAIHYGWAKLDVDGPGNVWTIKSFAYQSMPNVPILAGEGEPPLSIENNSFPNLKIVAKDKAISLYNLPIQTNYQLYNLSGQSVLNGKISGTKYTIEANALSDGIYVIEVMDSQSKAVIRKKIVL